MPQEQPQPPFIPVFQHRAFSSADTQHVKEALKVQAQEEEVIFERCVLAGIPSIVIVAVIAAVIFKKIKNRALLGTKPDSTIGEN